MTEAASVTPKETDLMAITLRKRSGRRDATPTGMPDEVAQAERAAMTALAQTLRRVALELPAESPLAVEFANVARCIGVAGGLGSSGAATAAPGIGVAGVLGTWGRHTIAREFADRHDTETAHAESPMVAPGVDARSDAA